MAFPNGLKEISGYAFNGCTGLTEMNLPDSVETIGYRAFYNCANLESFTYPQSWKEASSEIFKGCSKLTSISVPEGVLTIPDYAFNGADCLKQISFPSTLTKIGYQSFSSCPMLENPALPEGLLEISGYAFSSCAKLSAIQLPDTVTTIGYRAFYNCVKLNSVNYPMALTEASSEIFKGCSLLTSIVVPEGITTIPDYTFSGADYLRNITLPDSLTKIGYSAFSGCTQLRYMDLPVNLSIIESYAFYGCLKLRLLSLPISISTIGYRAFYNCPFLTIYCPSMSKSAIYLIDNDVAYSPIDTANGYESIIIDEDNCNYITSFSTISSGGTVQFNCDYSIKDTEYETLSNKNIKLRIPAGSTLLSKTLMYNNALCTSFTENDNYLTIPVTAQTGKITFSVKLTEDVDIISYAILEYSKPGDSGYEILGIVHESIPVLSVEAASITNSASIVVSGVAKAESTVSIYVDKTMIATSKANKTGYYSSNITLPNPINEKIYTIEAQMTDVSGDIIKAKTKVQYSTGTPVLTSFILNYSGNTYNLLSGSRPTLSFSSNNPMQFFVGFSHPENVKDVFVTSDRNNITKRLQATWDEDRQLFVAEGFFDPNDTGYVPGKLNVYYAEQDSMLNSAEMISLDDDVYSEIFDGATAEVIKDTSSETEIRLTFADGSVSTIGQQVMTMDEAVQKIVYGSSGAGKSPKKSPAKAGISPAAEVIKKFLKDSGKNYVKKVLADGTEVIYYQEWDEITFESVTTYVIDTGKESVTKAFFKDICPAATTYLLENESIGYVDDALGGFVWSMGYGGYKAVDGLYNTKKDLDAIRETIKYSNRTEEEKAYANELINDYYKQAKTIAVCKGVLTFVDAAITLTGIGMTPQGIILKAALFLVQDILLDMWEEQLNENILYLQGAANDTSVNWAIDPSGIVFDSLSNTPIQGAKTSAYWIPLTDDNSTEYWTQQPNSEEYGVLWDATDYSQSNPIFTDSNGYYSWDVPEGWWRVKIEIEGYETTWSDWVAVPPPQTEVNIGMNPSEIACIHEFSDWRGIDDTYHQRICVLDSSHIETGLHLDEDEDGFCDACLYPLDDPAAALEYLGACEYCGKVHTGPFAFIIKFFHRLIQFFRNMFVVSPQSDTTNSVT